jgi:hypothetical protein
MPSISGVYLTTTILIQLSNSQKTGSATGFFFSHNDNLYIVTNKHVIYGQNFGQNSIVAKPQIDTLKLNLHTNRGNLAQNGEVLLPLFKENEKRWLEHPSRDVDVVILPFIIDHAKYVVVPLDKTFIECEDIVVDDFQKIFVLGYPYGWYDRLNNLPVVRVGHLSSPFKIPFKGKPLMMGDVATHKGMSGGPVLMHLEDYSGIGKNGKTTRRIGGIRRLLVGINSGQFSIRQTDSERANLITIWFPEIILEILNHNGL